MYGKFSTEIQRKNLRKSFEFLLEVIIGGYEVIGDASQDESKTENYVL